MCTRPPHAAARFVAPLLVAVGLGAGACNTDAPAGAAGSSEDAGRSDVGTLTDTSGDDAGADPGTPEDCRSSEVCGDDDVCRVDRSGESIESTCASPAGQGEVGEACEADAECRANLCVGRRCTKPCHRDEECGEGWTCESTPVSTGSGEPEAIGICRPSEPASCVSDEECAATEACIGRRTDSEAEFVCGSPNNGGAATPSECQSDEECYRNLCADGRCASPCETSEDCDDSDLACEPTRLEWGDGNSDQLSMCRRLQPCDRPDDCDAEDVCYVERSERTDGGRCRLRNPGGGVGGDACKDDAECAANLCYDGRFRAFCTVPCEGDDDCPSGDRCEATSLSDGQGDSYETRLCVPEPPSSCSAQADCDSDQHCAIVPTPDGQNLESVCIPAGDGEATGSSCSSDDECNSRVCLEGTCASPCTDRARCAGDQICRENTIDRGMASGDFRVCETLAERECTDSGTCPDDVRTCSRLEETGSNRIGAFCQFPNDSAPGSLGDSCDGHDACRSSLCLGQITQDERFIDHCSVACRQDSQCADGQICTSLLLENSDVAACTRPCSSNAECAGSNVCQVNLSRLTDPNSIDTICTKPRMGAGFGDTCQQNADCRSGLCLNTYAFNATTCTGDADCSGGRSCEYYAQANEQRCAEIESQCTRVCDDGSTCSPGGDGNPLDYCGSSVSLEIPDGNGGRHDVQVSACVQQQ